MATWKTYGAGVVVSAGVTLTGVLWFNNRPSPFVAGEDLAELTAAANERLWALDINPGSRTVSCFAAKADIQAALDIARSPFTRAFNASRDYPDSFEHDSFESGAFFISGVIPADNAAVASAAGSWVIDHIITNAVPRTASTYMRYWKWNAAYPNGSTATILPLNTRYHSASSEKVNLNTTSAHETTNLPVNWILFKTSKAAAGNDSYYFGGTGNWWTANGYGTNLYAFARRTNMIERYYNTDWTGEASLSSARYYLRSHAITTNTLNAVKTLMQTCTQSVYVCRGMPGTGTVSETQGYGIYSRTLSGNGVVVSFMQSKARENAITNSVTTNTATSVYFPNRDIAFSDLNVVVYSVSPSPPYSTAYSSSSALGFKEYSYTNMVLSYPSASACASGLVSRVRVYLLCKRELPWYYTPAFRHYYWYGTYNPAAGLSVTLSSSTAAISDYISDDMGTGLKLATMPTNSAIISAGIADFPAVSGGAVEEPISTWYWTLVHDVFNPSGAVAYNWSPSTPNGPRNVEWKQWGDSVYTQPTKTETWTQYIYLHGIVCDYSMTVVDWNWKHLNPSTPFEPVTNIPPWIIANTNAP